MDTYKAKIKVVYTVELEIPSTMNANKAKELLITDPYIYDDDKDAEHVIILESTTISKEFITD